MVRRWAILKILSLLAPVLLAACGGGGGGDTGNGGDGSGTVAPRAMLPQVISDEPPAGERIDARADNHFPAAPGDRWHYAKVIGSTTVDTVLRQVVATPEAGIFRITESNNVSTSASNYRRSADGLVLVKPLDGALPPAAAAIVGDILEYAEPFHAIGAVRRVVRQGGLGSDIDGDTLQDSFRLEYTQVFQGYESVTLPDGRRVAAARFRNVSTATLQPSRADLPVRVSVGAEDAWWGPGIGLLRAERTLTDENGQALDAPYRLEITVAQVDGRTLLGPAGGGTQIEIALPHRALVFDAARSRYYASVPGSVVGTGNRLAAIDAATGAFTYSPPVGSDPGALALAPDGGALYVGLDGSGELLKLRLPDFVELQRTRLPSSQYSGQMFAENIAVSPVEPDVVAVSLFRANLSPSHGGVALLRAGVVQPLLTRDHTGSNTIVFAADGQSVFGFNNQSSEFGLRRLAVLPDGLAESVVVYTSGTGFDTRSIDLGPAGLVLGRGVYRPDDLSLLGMANLQGGCRAAGAKLVCTYDTPFAGRAGRLAVVDAATFVIEGTPPFELSTVSYGIDQIVVGPPGQVALRTRQDYAQRWSDTITLLRSPALP